MRKKQEVTKGIRMVMDTDTKLREQARKRQPGSGALPLRCHIGVVVVFFFFFLPVLEQPPGSLSLHSGSLRGLQW